MAWGVAGGREEVAGSAASLEQQGRSEVQGRGTELVRERRKEWGEEKKGRKKKGGGRWGTAGQLGPTQPISDVWQCHTSVF